jgi:quercetin dioxygenase-like cupin family protein
MILATNTAAILNLIGTIQAYLQRRQNTSDPVGREAARVISLLKPLPRLDGSFPRSTHPCTRYLDAALQAGNSSTSDLLDAIRPVAFDLPWYYTYSKRSDAPGLENEMAFAEIIGPQAPFKSENVCLGLTLIGPGTLYPSHTHPAIELYYVAAGVAKWTANGVSTLNPPGTFILHPSQVVHAMQTSQEPLLAVYSWSGEDVRTTSAYV